MKLQQKLAEWQQAGLIDSLLAARLLDHEQGRRKRPYLLYTVGGFGALSIALGLISMVAANWQAISPGARLALDVALLAALAVAVHRVDARARRPGATGGASWAREVLLFIYYGAAL